MPVDNSALDRAWYQDNRPMVQFLEMVEDEGVGSAPWERSAARWIRRINENGALSPGLTNSGWRMMLIHRYDLPDHGAATLRWARANFDVFHYVWQNRTTYALTWQEILDEIFPDADDLEVLRANMRVRQGTSDRIINPGEPIYDEETGDPGNLTAILGQALTDAVRNAETMASGLAAVGRAADLAATTGRPVIIGDQGAAAPTSEALSTGASRTTVTNGRRRYAPARYNGGIGSPNGVYEMVLSRQDQAGDHEVIQRFRYDLYTVQNGQLANLRIVRCDQNGGRGFGTVQEDGNLWLWSRFGDQSGERWILMGEMLLRDLQRSHAAGDTLFRGTTYTVPTRLTREYGLGDIEVSVRFDPHCNRCNTGAGVQHNGALQITLCEDCHVRLSNQGIRETAVAAQRTAPRLPRREPARSPQDAPAVARSTTMDRRRPSQIDPTNLQ